MKILIILPNWLGDAIMATPAIELLCRYYPTAQLTFVGSYVSIEALKHHPRTQRAIVDTTKKAPSRILATYQLAQELGKFDMALSFRNQIHATLLLRLTQSVFTVARHSWHAQLLLAFSPKIDTNQHLVKQYTQLALVNINNFDGNIPPLKLYIPKKEFSKPTLGINAGATYGSAKRWYPQRFAEVAAYFASEYDIIIFGGPNEVKMAQDIQNHLEQLKVNNFTNLAGKTTIEQLCATIGGCSLFITNDSGPMHVAAAYQVPTVAIFGPTRHEETSQWKNKKSVIVRHDMECSPCMKRECPLKHHECMTTITANEVIEAGKKLLNLTV
jgi:heptosyltransferase-2